MQNESITTDITSVEEMPNVKWNIKCCPEDPRDNGYIGVYLNVYSETDSSCIIDNVVNKFMSGCHKLPKHLFTAENLANNVKIVSGNDEYCLNRIQGYTDYIPNGNLIAKVQATFTKK
uniref:Uncharacterized protein n=1 Tax=Panagrolaimus sp. ES5 TaxID=591445 RepID=A0AC34GN98_9BILA